MNIIFNRGYCLFVLILILILSLGFVSASENLDDLNDMNYLDYESGLIIADSDMGDSNSLGAPYSNYDADGIFTVDNDIESDMELNNGNANSIGNSKLKSSSGNDFNDIQALIDNSNENDIITISGKYSGNSPIIVNKTLTLKGDDAVLDGGFITQILEVSSPNVVLSNIRFVNSYGISAYLGANGITVDNCSFENSTNGELGSALKANGNDIKILNSNFLNNIANKSSCHHTNGPAIYLSGNNALIDNCLFKNNTGYNYETASSGGAIWLRGTGCSVINSIFKDNKAISKFAWTLHSEEQTYLACGYGGAIYWVGNEGKIINCSFSDCVSHTNGGALYIMASDGFSIVNTSFSNNLAVACGGAVYLGQNVFNLKIGDSSFEENVALGLNGVVTPYECLGGAIYSGKFVEDVSIFNSTFLNNYGRGAIYYSGSNIKLANSILDMPNVSIDNSTLEGFLSVLKNSTFEECCLVIEDFSLYDYSGTFFENVIFSNGSLEGNYWGMNFNSTDEFKELKLVKSNDEYLSPDNWINLAVIGLNYLTNKGFYEYKFRFVLNDDSDALVFLPDYNIKLEHNILDNLIDSADFFIKEEYSILNYNYSKSGIDNLNIENAYGKLLDSLTIVCGAVYVEDTGNDTADIQNAIDGASPGSVIVLAQRNYTIDTINIDKNIVIYSNALANVSSSSKVFFNISSKGDAPDLTEVEINGLNFIVNNGNVLVLATAINDSSDDLIDIPNISILKNNLIKSGEDVLGESITILKLSSMRPILATTRNISLIANNLIEGANPFIFDITSVVNGSDVNIVNGSVINNNDDNSTVPEGNKTVSRAKSLIVSGDMTTTAVYSKDGKIGKYFTIRLTDSSSKAMAGKQIIINFNGKTYHKSTDKDGYVRMQINLANKGTYYISVCFLGDDKFDASFKSNKIKVNPIKAKLKVTNKKFKKSAKKKTLTAKFLSPKGKAVKAKKISFKINGKTYAAKTNSKGIATVKVKLSKSKIYKFTAKFAGDNTFKAISAKGKVIVK